MRCNVKDRFLHKLSTLINKNASQRYTKARWDSLPYEIRILILDYLVYDPRSLRKYATVSLEWQHYFESHKFSHLLIQDTDLDTLAERFTPRQRQYLRYLWFNVNFPNCPRWRRIYRATRNSVRANENLFKASIIKLFHILKTWGRLEITLEVSMHAHSDCRHFFEHWHLGSEDRSDPICVSPWFRCERKNLLDWWRPEYPVQILEDIYEPMGDVEFTGLPKISAVREFVWLRQSRKALTAHVLGQMLRKMENLETLVFEPWRAVRPGVQRSLDHCMRLLFEQGLPKTIRQLSVYEDSNEQHIRHQLIRNPTMGPIRIPHDTTSAAAAAFTIQLEHCSLAFAVDAWHFFAASKKYTFPHLKTLCLTTSAILHPNSPDFHCFLFLAAQGAKVMPQLQTMTVWFALRGSMSRFTYSRTDCSLTWFSNSAANLTPQISKAWQQVVDMHWYPDVHLKLHGFLVHVWPRCRAEGLYWLQLPEGVVHPVSLWQMESEAPKEWRSVPY